MYITGKIESSNFFYCVVQNIFTAQSDDSEEEIAKEICRIDGTGKSHRGKERHPGV